MTVLRPHPGRYDAARRLAALDPVTDAHEVWRTTVLYEFPWDARTAHKLAFYRPFAIPRIAKLLAHTGQLERDPRRRAIDTSLFMYELIHHGFDHPRGREVVRALNRMHRRWSIANEDYLYVLATFIVVPTRWIDRYGWRALLPVERAAAIAFYGRLGRLMAIRDIPATYEETAAFLDDYEHRYLAYSPAGERLAAATHQVVAELLPRRLRPLAQPATAALFDEPLARAVGVRPAGRPARAAVRAAVSVRNAVVRRRPPATDPWFNPGRSGTAIYPDGYQLSDLGVEETSTCE